MPSLRSVCSVALVAGLVAATPIELQRREITLPQVFRGTYKKHGAREMAKTYAKFHGAIPADVIQAAQANKTGTVVTNPGDQYDSLYLTPVTLGGTELMLDFDTGSSDLWVFSDELPANQQSGHAVYKTSASKKLQGYSWTIRYGDQSSASGDVYADTVQVGNVAVAKQAVEAAQKISAQFANDKDNDGLLGLAFSSINTVKPQQQLTWFDTAVKNGNIGANTFGVKLGHQKPGKYDFGFADTSSYTGEVAWAPIDSSQGFWQFTADGYAIGGKTTTSKVTTIADTGTTLIYFPTAIVDAYYKGVSGAKYDSQNGGYTFPCSTTLPDFGVVIGGKLVTTPGSYVNYAPVSGSTCFGGIQRNTGLGGLSILGDIFLKATYAIHDKATPRIGFAKQV